ncbi:MAG: ArgE/DapE family deacylase [Methanophagales archaeon]|nr:ArgE/DapE family deacylase [Methanophagales archaeon]
MEERKKEDLEKSVEREEKELIDYLKKLVRIPTFVPPGENYGKIVDWLIPVFEDFGFRCERVEMPEDVYEARQKSAELSGERVNLLATKDFGAEESVDIYTHLDVVPAGEGWSTPPFEPVIKDGRIYGRGVADSKGSVASLLTALSMMNEQGLESKYNLRVALTTDEEIGLYSGLCFFADEGLLQGDYLLCMDGDNEGICVATNGVMNWEIKVYGKSCHSSVPFLGVNAIEKAGLVIEELGELKRKVESRESKAPCSSYMTEVTGQKHITPVFNVTMISGGVKENIIPPSCTLRGDRRYIPEEAVEEVITEFDAFLQRVKTEHGIELELHCKPGFPPMFTNPDDEWVRRVKDAASYAFGVSKSIIGVQGGLDVAYAVQKTKQPVCAFGVGNWIESNAHGADENVRIQDLKDYVRFLVRLLT